MTLLSIICCIVFEQLRPRERHVRLVRKLAAPRANLSIRNEFAIETHRDGQFAASLLSLGESEDRLGPTWIGREICRELLERRDGFLEIARAIKAIRRRPQGVCILTHVGLSHLRRVEPEGITSREQVYLRLSLRGGVGRGKRQDPAVTGSRPEQLTRELESRRRECHHELTRHGLGRVEPLGDHCESQCGVETPILKLLTVA